MEDLQDFVNFTDQVPPSVIKQPTEEGFSERSERPRTGSEALQRITATTAAQRLRKVHFLLQHSENILLPNKDQHIINIP
ncbi:hypothetical protein PHLCEN_2v9102, partial [Hermanssonia centrifuga]